MSYSSTGFNSCVTSIFPSAISSTLIHTITIFSITGKKDFDFTTDFLNAFSSSQIIDIYNNADDFSTEYSATNLNGDEIYYDIDTTTTFTHTLTASQNNTNEKTTAILIRNPLIKGIHNIAYKTEFYVEEVPTTQQMTLTTNTVDKNTVVNSVTVVTDIDLKHAYLQNTYSAFSGVGGAGHAASALNFFKYIKAEIINNENFIDANVSSDTNNYCWSTTNYIDLRITLERYKYGFQIYWDTGNLVEIPFVLLSYNSDPTSSTLSETSFFKGTKTQILRFDITAFGIVSDTYHRKVYKYLRTNINDTIYPDSTDYGIYFKGEVVDRILGSLNITNVTLDVSNDKKIDIYVNNGVSGSGYSIIYPGSVRSYNSITVNGINGSMPQAIDGSSIEGGNRVDVTL